MSPSTCKQTNKSDYKHPPTPPHPPAPQYKLPYNKNQQMKNVFWSALFRLASKCLFFFGFKSPRI